MDILDHSDDEEEQGRYATISGRRPGSRFGARRLKRRPGGSHQHSLLMDCVGGGDGDGASEETVPLPDYERLSQSARLPDDPPRDDAKNPPQEQVAASPPQPPPPPAATQQQQKPAAWRLIEYVRSRHKSGAAGAASGCGAASDGDSKSSEDGDDGSEDGKKDKAKKKKRSSWLPDPDRRWPVQGFY
ncbi:oleosin-B6-like [Panicum miliaceum]|uniref:Oleosin-B6-like n=1 Tax=Panicum miliaceum TaxID=4540 RepID=A0A3L6TJ66_PANMI|nr:oleosin-B6-like [Panicum miliaceum]